MTMYSKWQVQVSFDDNNATNSQLPNEATYTSGDFITLPAKNYLEKTYHHFVGWNTKQDGTGDMYEERSTFKVGQESVTFYAQWKPIPVISSNVSIINNRNQADEITLKETVKEATYTIYKDSQKKEPKLDEFTATKEQETRSIKQLGERAGSIYISVKYPNSDLESDLTEVEYKGEISPTIDSLDVVIKNNANKEDIITFNKLKPGATYTIYQDSLKHTKLDKFEAVKTTRSILFDQLGKKAGSIFISVTYPDQLESELTEVKYDGEPSPLGKLTVTVTNNYNKADVIELKKLEIGTRYTIYKDANKKTKIDSFTANKTSKTIKTDKLSSKGGTIYVTVTKREYSESAVMKVNYQAEKLPALAAKNVKITNKTGSKDKIALKNLTKGYTYTIYKDAKLKKKLTSFKATGKTKTVSLKQVGAKKGQVYVVVSKSGYQSSTATKVSFKAEPTKALSSKNVTVTNTKKQDKIKFKNLKKGTTYTIYKDAKKKKKLKSFKATGTTKTITIKQLSKKAGKIYITAKTPNYEESAITSVSYPKEK